MALVRQYWYPEAGGVLSDTVNTIKNIDRNTLVKGRRKALSQQVRHYIQRLLLIVA